MKKVILFLLTIISVQVFGEVTQSVVFDFNFKEDKTGSMVFLPGSMVFSPEFTAYEWINGVKGQLAVTDRIASVDGYPIELEFKRGGGYGGVVINYTEFSDPAMQAQNYHSLQTRTSSLVTVRNTTGCELDSIRFYGSLGSLAGPSTGNLQRTLWVATTPTDTVQFMNHGSDSYITSMEVFYKKPSKPLSFVSSNPSAGSEVTTFNSMTLNFNLAINTSNYNESGITLSGPGISSPVAMSASAKGSSVTLSTGQTYTAYGDYNVNVPAGAFKNSEGGSHDVISIPFRVNPKRDILNYVSVSPTQGTVNQLPGSIEVLYDEYVSVPENSMATICKEGGKPFTAPIKLTEGNSKSVTIAHGREDITEEGVWTIEVPEKAIYNGMMGVEAEERWNPAFWLTYTVESAEAQELAQARQLISNTDNDLYGYPVKESEGYKALTTVINKGKDATVEEIKEAMGKYYTETNVKMPVADKWYRIAGVNDGGSVAYLTYADQKVTLKSSYTSADAFQAVTGNEGMEFKTKDERYLTVLGNPSGYDGFTYHQSGIATQLTVAKLAVENADSTKTIGKFSISGWLGRDGNDVDLGNSTAAISYPSLAIVASPTAEIYFSGATSSAFIFEETTEPVDPATSIQAELTFDNSQKGIEIENAGDPVTLVVHNVSAADIKDASAPYFEKQYQIGNPERIETTTPILTPVENSANYFHVNTTGLEAGEYLLYVPAETFNLTPPSGYASVVGTLATLSITIKGSSPTPELPDVTFGNNQKDIEIDNAGDAITLVVHNVQKADIADPTKPYFEKQNETGQYEPITTTPPILTKVENSAYNFNVITAGLEAGEYLLYVPAETFSYTPSSENASAVAKLNIKIKQSPNPNPNPIPNPVYSYPFAVSDKTRIEPDYESLNVIAEVWMNDLILMSGSSSIVPDTTKVITITSIDGGVIKTGRLKEYKNYKTEIGKINQSFVNQNPVAVKLVLDEPFEEGELEWAPAFYDVNVPREAIGDSNFGKWLKNKKFTGKCVVNEAGTFRFRVDDRVVKTPSASLSDHSLDAGSSLTLTIRDGGTVTLKDVSKVYFLKRGTKVPFTGTILTKSGDNTFTVNTKVLEEGNYMLVLPDGTFKYSLDGYYVKDVEMSDWFDIIVGSSINGISSTEDDGVYYDLSGRKVNAPTKKGIYIKNGLKVVVK